MKRQYANAERLVAIDGGTYVVRAYSILTTDTVVVEAYDERGTFADHSSSFTSATYGRISPITSRVPHDVMAMPVGSARSDAAARHNDETARLARRAIQAAFPELVSAIDLKSDGRGYVSLGDYAVGVA